MLRSTSCTKTPQNHKLTIYFVYILDLTVGSGTLYKTYKLNTGHTSESRWQYGAGTSSVRWVESQSLHDLWDDFCSRLLRPFSI